MQLSAFHLLPVSLILSLATAIQLPDLQPFFSAIPNFLQDLVPQTLQNATAHELLKRQSSDSCPQGFDSCSNLGAPGLCCASDAVCSADFAGMVACCPTGAACTGTITGVITSGTVDGNGVVILGDGGGQTGVSIASTTSFELLSGSASNNGLVAATTTAATLATSMGNGFIVDGASTVATPAGGVRRADIPLIVKTIVHFVQHLGI